MQTYFMTEKKKPEDDSLAVFYSDYDLKCAECGKDILKHSLIFNLPVKRAVCLSCAGLDKLVYLPSGNTALTVRSCKYPEVSAVVMTRDSVDEILSLWEHGNPQDS